MDKGTENLKAFEVMMNQEFQTPGIKTALGVIFAIVLILVVIGFIIYKIYKHFKK